MYNLMPVPKYFLKFLESTNGLTPNCFARSDKVNLPQKERSISWRMCSIYSGTALSVKAGGVLSKSNSEIISEIHRKERRSDWDEGWRLIRFSSIKSF